MHLSSGWVGRRSIARRIRRHRRRTRMRRIQDSGRGSKVFVNVHFFVARHPDRFDQITIAIQFEAGIRFPEFLWVSLLPSFRIFDNTERTWMRKCRYCGRRVPTRNRKCDRLRNETNIRILNRKTRPRRTDFGFNEEVLMENKKINRKETRVMDILLANYRSWVRAECPDPGDLSKI
jgi:hypothetical protein